jgi:hypothetical protein
MDVREAERNALEARRKMRDARPKDTIPPPPDSGAPDQSICSSYFRAAAALYGEAAGAYAQGDWFLGHTLEVWAFQHLELGQRCLESTGGLGDRAPS